MFRNIMLTIALLAVIAVNALANILPFNGQTTGEISNRLPVLFTPAGYVFSIWSVIYVLLAIWVIFQWRNKPESTISTKQFTLFLLSCLFNIAWIFSWHYEYFALSVVIMIALLITLTFLYLSYPNGDAHLYGRLPFSIYLGWICVATIANISYTLTDYGWNGFGLSDPLWAVILLTIGAALAAHIRFHHEDPYLPLVFIWAFIGIAVRHGFDELLVSTAALFLSAVLVASILFIKKQKNKSLGAE